MWARFCSALLFFHFASFVCGDYFSDNSANSCDLEWSYYLDNSTGAADLGYDNYFNYTIEPGNPLSPNANGPNFAYAFYPAIYTHRANPNYGGDYYYSDSTADDGTDEDDDYYSHITSDEGNLENIKDTPAETFFLGVPNQDDDNFQAGMKPPDAWSLVNHPRQCPPQTLCAHRVKCADRILWACVGIPYKVYDLSPGASNLGNFYPLSPWSTDKFALASFRGQFEDYANVKRSLKSDADNVRIYCRFMDPSWNMCPDDFTPLASAYQASSRFLGYIGDMCDADSILTFDRKYFPTYFIDESTPNLPGVRRACIADSDCHLATVMPDAPNATSFDECVAGTCFDSSDYEIPADNFYYLAGACGQHDFGAYPKIVSTSTDDAPTVYTFSCIGAETNSTANYNPYEYPGTPGDEVSKIADSCALCAYEVAHNWKYRAVVSSTNPLRCKVVRRYSYNPEGGEHFCDEYFDGNIFIAREGQREYESLAGERPGFLLVGEIPLDRSKPWRPFSISPVRNTPGLVNPVVTELTFFSSRGPLSYDYVRYMVQRDPLGVPGGGGVTSGDQKKRLLFRHAFFMNSDGKGALDEVYHEHVSADFQQTDGADFGDADVRLPGGTEGIFDGLCCNRGNDGRYNAETCMDIFNSPCSPFQTSSEPTTYTPRPVLLFDSGVNEAQQGGHYGEDLNYFQGGDWIFLNGTVTDPSATASVLNYGLNHWSQKTYCPFLETATDTHFETDALIGVNNDMMGYLFTDFVVAPLVFDNANDVYGTAHPDNLTDVNRSEFNVDKNLCRPTYDRSKPSSFNDGSFIYVKPVGLKIVENGTLTSIQNIGPGTTQQYFGPFLSNCSNVTHCEENYLQVFVTFADNTSSTLFYADANNTKDAFFDNGFYFPRSSDSTDFTSFLTDRKQKGELIFESGRVQHLKDYCLRRDSGVMRRGTDGLPDGCWMPPLPGDTAPRIKPGPQACFDEDGVPDPDCYYHLTGNYLVEPSPASEQPTTTTTTTTAKIQYDFPSSDDGFVNDVCDIQYVEAPELFVSGVPYVTEVTSGSRECQDLCDLFEYCVGFRYVNPTCRLFRSETEIPLNTSTGIDSTETFIECWDCSTCFNHTHVRILDNGTFNDGTPLNECFSSMAQVKFSSNEIDLLSRVEGTYPRFSAVKIEDGVTELSNNFFSHVEVDTLIIPGNVTKIDPFAFNGAKISTIDLSAPASITIKEDAFFHIGTVTNIFFNGQQEFSLNYRDESQVSRMQTVIGILMNKFDKSLEVATALASAYVNLRSSFQVNGTNRYFHNFLPYFKPPQYTIFKQRTSGIGINNESDFTLYYNNDYANEGTDYDVTDTLYGYGMFNCARRCDILGDGTAPTTARWSGYMQKCECLDIISSAIKIVSPTFLGSMLIEYDGSPDKCPNTTVTTSTPAPTTTAAEVSTVYIRGKLKDTVRGDSYCSFSPAYIYPLYNSSAPSGGPEYLAYEVASDSEGGFSPGDLLYISTETPAGCTETLPPGVAAVNTTTTTTTSPEPTTTTTTTTTYFTEFTSDDERVATAIIASVASVAGLLVIVNVCVNRRRDRQYSDFG